MKICTKCGQSKQLEEFRKEKARKTGYGAECRACSNLRQLRFREKNPTYNKHALRKKLYGITKERFEQMIENQHGCCAICNMHQSTLKRALAVDHHHETGEIRGLLCSDCNTGLGLLKEKTALLYGAAYYLLHYSKAGEKYAV